MSEHFSMSKTEVGQRISRGMGRKRELSFETARSIRRDPQAEKKSAEVVDLAGYENHNRFLYFFFNVLHEQIAMMILTMKILKMMVMMMEKVWKNRKC